MKVFADPKNPDVVWVLNANVSRSIDGGKTFTNVRTPHGDNHSLWLNPQDPDTLIQGNDGGANVSFNGGRTWSTQGNQPTAQFYRVNVDNLFPYNVYGGQQDNTSVKIASAAPGGITERDWYDVGGCESAVPAFDPDKPRYVYAGCYMGIISEFDDETKTAHDVMAWPQMPAAVAPSEQNVPLQLERADRGLALQLVGDLSRRQRAAAVGQSRQVVARGQPGPDAQRQEQAGARRRADHQRGRRGRNLRRHRRHRRISPRCRDAVGGHRRRSRPAHA